jgi:hypothetical protein
MASLRHTHTDTLTGNRAATPRARTGGPRRHLRATTAHERNERFSNDRRGSHMPIDTGIHWEWRNPLNILPALVLFVMVIAVLGMVFA